MQFVPPQNEAIQQRYFAGSTGDVGRFTFIFPTALDTYFETVNVAAGEVGGTPQFFVNSSVTVFDTVTSNSTELSIGNTTTGQSINIGGGQIWSNSIHTNMGVANVSFVANNTGLFANQVQIHDITVVGNLTVQGTQTSVETTSLIVQDKNIELGNAATPSNTTASGGGITLKGGGDGDKTITWDSTNQSWDSSENFNLASGKKFRINDVDAYDQIVPTANVTYDLGTDALYFKNAYVSYSYNDIVNVGSGQFWSNSTYTEIGGVAFSPGGSTTAATANIGSGMLYVNSTHLATGTSVNDNYISNSSGQFFSNGINVVGHVGSAVTEALLLPAGTTAQRPGSMGASDAGRVRFNSTLGSVEVWDSTLWKPVSGASDADNDTKILFEDTAGGDQDHLRFVIAGADVAKINSTSTYANTLSVGEGQFLSNSSVSQFNSANADTFYAGDDGSKRGIFANSTTVVIGGGASAGPTTSNNLGIPVHIGGDNYQSAMFVQGSGFIQMANAMVLINADGADGGTVSLKQTTYLGQGILTTNTTSANATISVSYTHLTLPTKA